MSICCCRTARSAIFSSAAIRPIAAASRSRSSARKPGAADRLGFMRLGGRGARQCLGAAQQFRAGGGCLASPVVAGGIGVTPILAMRTANSRQPAPRSPSIIAPEALRPPRCLKSFASCLRGPPEHRWFSTRACASRPPHWSLRAILRAPISTCHARARPDRQISSAHALSHGWSPEQIHAEKFQALRDGEFPCLRISRWSCPRPANA